MAAVSAVVLTCGLCPVASATTDAGTACEEVALPVALAPGAPPTWSLHGHLCSPGPLAGRPIQVLVHGITYDRQYWEWPQDPSRYSYAASATSAGYATLALDRLGVGASDKPPALALTLDSNAYTLHQVIQAIRDGKFGGVPSKVVAVGHSYGSFTVGREAGLYADVDAVVLSGWSSLIAPTGVVIGVPNLTPAQLDPVTAPAHYPLGYLTTVAGKRGEMFYNPDHTDPRVLALDEATKQTLTAGEAATLAAQMPLSTQQIRVPVLIANGGQDQLFCTVSSICQDATTYRQAERPVFPAVPCLSSVIVPRAGHDLNLDLDAPTWFGAARRWIDAVTAGAQCPDTTFTGG